MLKSWRQHPTKHQLYGHLPPITKTIQVRRTRHAGHCWRSKDELTSDVLLWTAHMAEQKQDDQLEHTYSSYVRIRDVVLKSCQRRWTIGKSGERVSGISVLAARHDDDDDGFSRIKCIHLVWKWDVLNCNTENNFTKRVQLTPKLFGSVTVSLFKGISTFVGYLILKLL